MVKGPGSRRAEVPDPPLEALQRLLDCLGEIDRDFAAIRVRAEHIVQRRAEGRSYSDLVVDEQRPLIVELLTSVQEKLIKSGSGWRREEARALHNEGVSMDRIAELFGVTRQRVSALLKR